MRIFISYSSSEPEEHQADVVSLTNYLRQNGYDARVDKFEMGNNTAVDFCEMMSSNMQKSDKVIIILSESYKTKADSFKGGVGYEYRDIIGEIIEKPNKYIIGTFTLKEIISVELINRISPYSLKKREVISLFDKDLLIRKLNDIPEYNFSEVSNIKPSVKSKEIEDYNTRIRSKDLNFYDFENLFTYTRYEFKSHNEIIYEVFRTIQITGPKLTKFEVRPSFTCKSKVKISSLFFDSFDMVMDDNNVVRFDYPIPSDNKKGDIITIQYKIEFNDEKMESLPVWTYKNVNDSRLIIMDIILREKKNNPPAVLSKILLSKDSVDYDFIKVNNIDFNINERSYRVSLQNPEKNVLFKIEWEK